MVNDRGGLELYDGKLRAIDGERADITLDDISSLTCTRLFHQKQWRNGVLHEGTHVWKKLEEKGWNRVGHLPGIEFVWFIPTLLAEKSTAGI